MQTQSRQAGLREAAFRALTSLSSRPPPKLTCAPSAAPRLEGLADTSKE